MLLLFEASWYVVVGSGVICGERVRARVFGVGVVYTRYGMFDKRVCVLCVCWLCMHSKSTGIV